MQIGGVRYDTVEVKKYGIVLVAREHTPALGLSHRSHFCRVRASILERADPDPSARSGKARSDNSIEPVVFRERVTVVGEQDPAATRENV
jgi:hypothetical protein